MNGIDMDSYQNQQEGDGSQRDLLSKRQDQQQQTQDDSNDEEERANFPAAASDDDGGNRETERSKKEISNEYVLNVAFYSFVGFMILEAIFAIFAGSASMLEDAEAMSVDALTYLFNLCAERIKKRPYSEKEMKMAPHHRAYYRELHRLYLELVPPLISVTTLIAVTIMAIQDAVVTLKKMSDDESQINEEEDVNVSIMFTFSALNLLLDIVNVVCFARAEQAFGLFNVKREHSVAYPRRDSTSSADGYAERRYINESQHLLYDQPNELTAVTESDEIEQNNLFVNLNMCSAWTHVCADTLRSTAVLIAASIAYVFDGVSGLMADTMAAIVVSLIILISLLPLLQGLVLTAQKIITLSTDPSRPI